MTLEASTKDFDSLEEMSWAHLEVREGFQKEVASESCLSGELDCVSKRRMGGLQVRGYLKVIWLAI